MCSIALIDWASCLHTYGKWLLLGFAGFQDRKNLEEALTKLMQPTKWLVEHKALLPLLTQLKVLSRTEANRKMIKEEAIAQLLRHISDRGVGTKIQGEGANVVLNICYEKENVKAVLACGGASTLVRTWPN